MTLDDIRHRATIDIPEAAEILGMGLRQTYAAAREGKLPTLRLSRRMLIPVPAFLRLLGEEVADGHK